MDDGFDDEEVLEQYRIMAQHEATLRVRANIGFDMADYEKRRKTSGNENKDKKDMYGGGKKPKLGLPPPQFVLATASSSNHGGMAIPPILSLSQYTRQRDSSEYRRQFLMEQKKCEGSVAELFQGEKARANESVPEGEHIVRCWGCKSSLKVHFLATLVNCPDCGTVSQARTKKS